MIDPRAEAMVLSAFGSVPGVHARGILAGGSMYGRPTCVLHMSCWSPSLHRIEARITVPVPILPTPHAQGRRLLRDLDRRLAQQRTRAAAALALGHAKPMDAKLGASVMGHVGIDRGLVALLFGDREDDACTFGGIADMHNDMTYDGGHRIYSDDHIDDEGRPGGVFRSIVRIGDGLHYDGQILSVYDRSVPESVRQSVAGCRLGEIVEVPEAIAGHTVISWTDDEDDVDWTVIKVEQDLVRFADVPQLRAP